MVLLADRDEAHVVTVHLGRAVEDALVVRAAGDVRLHQVLATHGVLLLPDSETSAPFVLAAPAHRQTSELAARRPPLAVAGDGRAHAHVIRSGTFRFPRPRPAWRA